MEHCLVCEAELPPPELVGCDLGFGVEGEFAVSICPTCGAGVSVPVLEAGELASFYPPGYEAYRAVDGAAARLLFRAYHAWRDVLTRRSPPVSDILSLPPGRLLDVGCGKGDPGELLVRGGWTVVGVDLSDEACGIARTRGIDAREGVLGNVDLTDAAPFDAILFHHSLEHVADPVAELRLAASLLKPAGALFVSVPNFGSWQRVRFGTHWYPLELPRHRTHFTARSLAMALARAGLEPVATSTQSTFRTLPLSLQHAAFG